MCIVLGARVGRYSQNTKNNKTSDRSRIDVARGRLLFRPILTLVCAVLYIGHCNDFSPRWLPVDKNQNKCDALSLGREIVFGRVFCTLSSLLPIILLSLLFGPLKLALNLVRIPGYEN